MIRYRELAPPPALRSAVECVWRGALTAGSAGHEQRVLPDGCMDVIWNGRELTVAGPDTAAFTSWYGPGSAAVGVRFHPGAAPALLGVPAEVLRDTRVPLAELRAGAAAAATARIGDGEPAARVLLETVAGFRAGAGPPVPALGLVAARLRAGAGAAELADELGWTTRTLHRRCRAAFGYGPATLRRILRFRRAVALAAAAVPVAEVAARAGYADQPHLYREVRALAGVPLAQLVGSGANRSTPVPSGSRTTA